MRNELMQAIDACQACQADRPTQARTPLKGKQPPSSAEIPMKHVGADLFDVQGKDWLTLVDRYSGYAWAEQLRSTNTRAVINSLSSWFNEFGWPDYIRTDGGPQFREEFKRFCKEKNIMHELSSAYNPESNGLAEAAVKNMKKLILRCKEKGENIPQAIAAWRNMARADGLSPSQLFYGRRQKQLLPLSSTHKQVAARSDGLELHTQSKVEAIGLTSEADDTSSQQVDLKISKWHTRSTLQQRTTTPSTSAILYLSMGGRKTAAGGPHPSTYLRQMMTATPATKCCLLG